MLFSVEQAFVGREEIRAPLKMPAGEAIAVRVQCHFGLYESTSYSLSYRI